MNFELEKDENGIYYLTIYKDLSDFSNTLQLEWDEIERLQEELEK